MSCFSHTRALGLVCGQIVWQSRMSSFHVAKSTAALKYPQDVFRALSYHSNVAVVPEQILSKYGSLTSAKSSGNVANLVKIFARYFDSTIFYTLSMCPLWHHRHKSLQDLNTLLWLAVGFSRYDKPRPTHMYNLSNITIM